MQPFMIAKYGVERGLTRTYECIQGNNRDLPIVYQYPADGQRDVPLDAVVIGIFKKGATFSNWSGHASYEDGKPLSILSGRLWNYFLVGNLIEHGMVKD